MSECPYCHLAFASHAARYDHMEAEHAPDLIVTECEICEGSGEVCIGETSVSRWSIDPPEPIFTECECRTIAPTTWGWPITLEDLDQAEPTQ
jgi:hypothetical protein